MQLTFAGSIQAGPDQPRLGLKRFLVGRLLCPIARAQPTLTKRRDLLYQIDHREPVQLAD
jgi:hypothetical protein